MHFKSFLNVYSGNIIFLLVQLGKVYIKKQKITIIYKKCFNKESGFTH